MSACLFIRAKDQSDVVSTVSLGKGSTLSKLERISRQNSLIWQTLYDLKATYPPETSGPNKGKPPRVSLCDRCLPACARCEPDRSLAHIADSRIRHEGFHGHACVAGELKSSVYSQLLRAGLIRDQLTRDMSARSWRSASAASLSYVVISVQNILLLSL